MSMILTTVVSIFVFGFLILFHEAGHFFTAKKCGIQVNEFSIGMGPTLFKKVRGGTQYSVRLLPIGGYVSMEGENGEEEPGEAGPEDEPAEPIVKTGKPFNEVSLPRRMLVVAAGALMNLLLGFLVIVLMICVFDDAITSKTVHSFTEGALCEQTGLAAGDTILAVNGRRCFVADDIINELLRTPDFKADFTVKRDGKTVELPGVQFDQVVEEDGRVTMGLGFKVYGIEKGFLSVVKEAGCQVVSFARSVFLSLIDLLTGRVSVNQLSGPVGIVSIINNALGAGLRYLLLLTGLLTVNLGVFNLLPIPALDGGRLVLLLVEAVIRRPVPRKLEMAVNTVGMLCLFGLMLFVTFNDITRLM